MALQFIHLVLSGFIRNQLQYPLIRVKISSNGYSKIYGYDFVNGTGNYKELVLVNAVYQKVPINLTGNNTIVIGQDNTWAPSNLNAEFNTYSSAGTCDYRWRWSRKPIGFRFR